jgi:histidine ammonia-lyase
MPIKISDNFLSIKELQFIHKQKDTIELNQESIQKIVKSRAFLENKVKSAEKPIYGINTGFGQLCDKEISLKDLDQLQVNLVRSHACGVGEEIPDHLSRLILLLKIKSLTTGHSAVRKDLIDFLLFFYNSGAVPVIFEKGSLGASGDLVPLAHLSLPMMGEGEVKWKNQKISGLAFLSEFKKEPISLKLKEGLAMLNGTQFMLAYGIDNVWRSQHIMNAAIAICGLSIDAFDSRTDFLHPSIHKARPHKGQMEVASRMLNLLNDSEIAKKEKFQVQDPYSVRCLPQVLGASLDSLNYVASVLETELNSVTDNPLVFEEDDLVISGGNFHGQPLALVLDFLGIAMAEVANICERLLYKLLAGERNLPAFLTNNPGLESGFMIPQYSAASLVSQNKQLATPASVDSIVSSNGQEDHVSMGANAGVKCARILDNTEAVLGILLLAGAQALDFRRPLKSSSKIEEMVSEFRTKVTFRSADSYFKPDMDSAIKFVKEYPFENMV